MSWITHTLWDLAECRPEEVAGAANVSETRAERWIERAEEHLKSTDGRERATRDTAPGVRLL